MHRLTVFERDHAQDTRTRLARKAHLAPEADPLVLLRLAAERSGAARTASRISTVR